MKKIIRRWLGIDMCSCACSCAALPSHQLQLRDTVKKITDTNKECVDFLNGHLDMLKKYKQNEAELINKEPRRIFSDAAEIKASLQDIKTVTSFASALWKTKESVIALCDIIEKDKHDRKQS